MPEQDTYADKQRREPDYTEIMESVGARRAAQIMHECVEDIGR